MRTSRFPASSCNKELSFFQVSVSKMLFFSWKYIRSEKGGLAMSHITMKFWLVCAFAAVIWVVFGGMVASGQTPPPAGNNDIVLSGFLGCGNPGPAARECP